MLSLLLLLLIGCPATSPDAPDGPEASDGSLDVLTYNVHGFTPSLAGDDPVGRMPQIAALLADFDLVGHQEVWVPDYVDVLSEHHASVERFDTPLNEERVYGSGLVMLSQLGQIDYAETHYDTCNGVLDSASDCLASKGLQFQRLQLADGAELDWYNTHLEAGGDENDQAARADHVDTILDELATRSVGRAVLLTGDLNLHSDGDRPADWDLLASLADAGLIDSCEAVDCDDPTHIDRLMSRSGDDVTLGATAWQDDPRFFDAAGEPLSDHPAIQATFEWAFTPSD
jgi:endonuclease/exonuclease/phosphatase family metal-dependent hydrolase